MKSACLLLLAVFCAGLDAQTTARCADNRREIPFHDRPCPKPMGAGGANRAAPGKSSAPPRAAPPAWTGPQYWQNDRTPPPAARHLQAKVEAQAIAARLQPLQKAADERKAAGYAENRLRCERARQVAALCGKSANAFHCGERGFLPLVVADSDVGKPAMSNDARYQMERCARQAIG